MFFIGISSLEEVLSVFASLLAGRFHAINQLIKTTYISSILYYHGFSWTNGAQRFAPREVASIGPAVLERAEHLAAVFRC